MNNLVQNILQINNEPMDDLPIESAHDFKKWVTVRTGLSY